MKTILIIACTLVTAICFSQKSDTLSNDGIDLNQLQGNWKFTYIEAFDWSEFGFSSDSLEIQYYISFDNGEFLERMEPNDSGFVRLGNYTFEEKTNTLCLTVNSQKSHDTESNKAAIGMRINLKILKIDSANIEVIYTFPDNADKASSLNSLGKCILAKTTQ